MTGARSAAVRLGLVAALVAGGCAPAANLVCLPSLEAPLPAELPETSGAAWSSRDPGIFWTVNDGSQGDLFAVDTTGAGVARIRTRGGRLEDVEDLSAGACPTGRCLYLADVGDNEEIRDQVAIERVPEPSLDDTVVERTRFPFRYPDGPRDAEAVVVLPGEEILVLSKGRSSPVTVYRYPPPLKADTLVELERLHTLADRRPSRPDMVTGAVAVPGTDRVLVRTYSDLGVFQYRDGRLTPLPDARISLGSLQEPQGEAVAADGMGRVLLTSEAGPFRNRSGMHLLRCEVGSAT